ncbi:MAG: hypothetical protein WAS07_06440 [Micropruina sp.]
MNAMSPLIPLVWSVTALALALLFWAIRVNTDYAVRIVSALALSAFFVAVVLSEAPMGFVWGPLVVISAATISLWPERAKP